MSHGHAKPSILRAVVILGALAILAGALWTLWLTAVAIYHFLKGSP